MTLNITYHLPDEYINKLPDIYSQMEGWMGNGGHSVESGFWYSLDFNEKGKFVRCYDEPSGLCFTANMDKDEWGIWKSKFKELATKVLGFKVGEPALGDCEYPVFNKS